MKPSLRAFCAGFALTMVLIGTASGFWVVDVTTSSYGLDAPPLFAWVDNGPLDKRLVLLGKTLPLPMELLNSAVGLAEHYGAWLLPRSGRVLAQTVYYFLPPPLEEAAGEE